MEIERKGTEWMSIVSEWGENVCVSEDKTVIVLLKGGMAESRRPCVQMNGKLIKYAECVKYLGVSMSECILKYIWSE